MQIKESETVRCPVCCNRHAPGPCATDVILFTCPVRGQNVFLVGSWSGWQKKDVLSERNGALEIEMCLQPGRYQYKYIVDGLWMHDQHAPKVRNQMGTWNNQVQVVPKKAIVTLGENGTCRITSHVISDSLQVVGEWDNWSKALPLTRRHNSLFKRDECFIDLALEPGRSYQFKFRLAGVLLYDDQLHHCPDGQGGFNNLVFVQQLRNKLSSIHKLGWFKVPIAGMNQIFGHSFCHIGQNFYIFGGVAGGAFTNSLLKLNSVNGELAILSCEGEPRAYHGAYQYGSKLLFYSGINGQSYLDDYVTYNISSNEWSTVRIKGEPPSLREKFTCTGFGNQLFIFGGYFCHGDMEHEQNFNDVFVLDLQLMQWSRPTIAGVKPQGRCSHTAAVLNDMLYVFGGKKVQTRTTLFNDLWALDLKDSAWALVQAKGKPPQQRFGHSMQPLCEHLVVFGGKGEKKCFNDVHLFASKRREWLRPEVQGQQPKRRWEHTSAKLSQNEIVIFGGRTKQAARHYYVLRFST